ncbi:MAG: DUF6268 family outer membrane beta-barrel protein [Cyclobacteriaceae bacterium]
MGSLTAQDLEVEKSDTVEYCKTSLSGSPRPKFLEVSRTSSYFYNATASNYLDNSEEKKRVVSNDKIQAKLKFPLWMKPGFSVFGAVGYTTETFTFEKAGPSVKDQQTFLSNIDQQVLKGVSAKMYATKLFKSNKFLFARAGIKFQGDYHESNSRFNSYLNYEAGLMYGWKVSERFQMGAGVAVTNNFGRFSAYPIFAYQRNFKNGVAVEALLPAAIKVRYTTPDHKNNFQAAAEANGSNYRISKEGVLPGASGPIVWQNANVDLKLGYEREIHDWLWFNVEAGVRQNLRSRIRYQEAGGSEIIYNCDWDRSLVFQAGIFLVPPRKLLEKH